MICKLTHNDLENFSGGYMIIIPENPTKHQVSFRFTRLEAVFLNSSGFVKSLCKNYRFDTSFILRPRTIYTFAGFAKEVGFFNALIEELDEAGFTKRKTIIADI